MSLEISGRKRKGSEEALIIGVTMFSLNQWFRVGSKATIFQCPFMEKLRVFFFCVCVDVGASAWLREKFSRLDVTVFA